MNAAPPFAPDPRHVARVVVTTPAGSTVTFERNTADVDTLDPGDVTVTLAGRALRLVCVETEFGAQSFGPRVKPVLAEGLPARITLAASYAYEVIDVEIDSVETTFLTGLAGVRGRIDVAAGYWPSIDVGDGWLPVVARLGDRLAGIDPGYVVHQIKEKFGGLRFYAQRSAQPAAGVPLDIATAASVVTVRPAAADEFTTAIAEAEAEALRTCQRCGTTDDTVALRTEGWWRTLCDGCEASRSATRTPQ